MLRSHHHPRQFSYGTVQLSGSSVANVDVVHAVSRRLDVFAEVADGTSSPFEERSDAIVAMARSSICIQFAMPGDNGAPKQSNVGIGTIARIFAANVLAVEDVRSFADRLGSDERSYQRRSDSVCFASRAVAGESISKAWLLVGA